MDLITIMVIGGNLANGVLLTLCMRYTRGAELSAARCEEQLGLANEVLPKLLNATSEAIAALPKKRKPRAKMLEYTPEDPAPPTFDEGSSDG